MGVPVEALLVACGNAERDGPAVGVERGLDAHAVPAHGGDSPAGGVVLVVGVLVQGVGFADQAPFAVVGVLGGVARAVGVARELAQAVPLEAALAAVGVGDAGGPVGKLGVVVGVAGDAPRPGR